ncbi:MAG: xanthine dehydrogenase family protein molybdopterin-binding subunit [Syntrophomonadaceae bacterium]
MSTSIIGTDIIRKEAWDKVTGRAKYNSDISYPGLLHAVQVTSTCAHGYIKRIDYSQAITMKGVKKVITGGYYSFLTGSVLADRPPLAIDKVRYYGEPVALVIADSEAQAKAAATRVVVEYEKLVTVDSPSAAMQPEAPLIHPDLAQYRHVIEQVYPAANTNINNHEKIRKGDMDKGWNESEVIIEARYSLPSADHIAMETRNVRAEILPDGQVLIYSSSQAPFGIRKQISDHFGFDLGKVIVHVPLVGGGYGGKAAINLEFLAVMASLAVDGRPVVVSNTREQDIASSPSKVSLEAYVKLGASKDGILKAGQYTYIVGTGAYTDTGPRMGTSMTVNCTGPYNVENVWCDAYCVYTNHTYVTSFRGFGHSSFSFAVERTMDKLAAALQIDPLQLRRQNAIQAGHTSPTGVKLTESILGNVSGCLDKVEKMINWSEGDRIETDTNLVRAKGVACFWKTSNSPTDAISSATVTFNSDASVNLNVGAVEIGPSTKSTLAQILADTMKLDFNKVHVEMEVNTRTSPHHWKTVASMTTFMVGRAVEEAAHDAIRQIQSLAAIALQCSPSDLTLGEGQVYFKDDPSIFVDLAEVVHGYQFPDGSTIGSQVVGRGTYGMPRLSPLDRNTGGGKPGPYWTPGAQAVEIELDLNDCSYTILRAATVLDAGKVLNPRAAKGLVMGAMGMGLGLGSREYFIYDKDQRLQNDSLRTYKVMRIGEQPEYLVDWVETPHQASPFGARGLAEHGIIAIYAALVNALSRAAGIEFDQVPVLPETIWQKREGMI